MDDPGIIKAISSGYKRIFGVKETGICPLPRSGSDRRYFRITEGKKSIIGAFNANREENDAFIGFTYHFRTKSLPVPEVYGFLPEQYVYYLQDLGDDNLYTWLHKRPVIAPFDNSALNLYKKILEKLVLFQVRGIDGLNLDLCYPHRSFDRQSMMWDMNYFKYMLLKLLAVPFNERRLENDFNSLADYLLATRQDYFLYRDFQTANVMVVDGEPWFIDYQGGRKGAPQYDVASMLYDAKIPMAQEDREVLLDHYISCLRSETGLAHAEFTGYFTGFSIIRVMQALGAFGFRGLYEQKPTFTDSIVPGVILINEIADRAEKHIKLNELYSTIRAIPSTTIFQRLKAGRVL
jgi:aminoglycoside/choline kinase family phosphotransferase